MPKKTDNTPQDPNDGATTSTNEIRQNRPSPSQGESDRPSITKALEGFLCEVDALADTLPLVMPLVAVSKTQVSKEFNEFLRGRCEKLSRGGFAVPPDEYTEFLNLQRRLHRNRRALQIIPRSFFTSLISHYDAFW